MSDLERRVRQAFDDVQAPAEVKRATLAHIESMRQASSPCEAPPAQPPVASPKPRNGFRAVRFRRIAAVAACLALAVTCLSGYRLYTQPTAYVGIDVNPSIELSVNRFGFVVGAEGLNQDGDALLRSVSLVNRSFADALTVLTGSEAFVPYAQEDSFVDVSVSSDDEAQAERLCALSDAELSSLPCRNACSVVDAQTRQAATAAGMGVARYRAAIQLIELDPSLTLEECAALSMRELRDRLASFGQAYEDAAGGHGGGEGHGKGAGGHGQGSGRGAGRGAGGGSGARDTLAD